MTMSAAITRTPRLPNAIPNTALLSKPSSSSSSSPRRVPPSSTSGRDVIPTVVMVSVVLSDWLDVVVDVMMSSDVDACVCEVVGLVVVVMVV